MRAGQVVAGRYRLEGQVGAGGNGVVWRATDEHLDRLVALKRALPGPSGQHGEQLQQLRREARLLAQLNHPHIVTLYDVLDDGAECWLVLEYVPARSLAEHGVLPPELVARLGAQIADALAAVHAKGMLHRDITPANILMISEDEAKLGDFGISRLLAGEETVTGSSLLAGTPGYVAPEVANGGDPIAASDIFSLGSTLYAAVEGASPVGGKTDNPFLRLRRAAEGRLTPSRNSGPLAPVLTEMLRVDPKRRPDAATTRRLLADLTGAGRRARQTALRRWLLSAGALVAVLALVTWLVLVPRTGDQTASLMGDQRTADPCKLFDLAGLRKFGDVNLTPDEYRFDRCDVIVKVDDTSRETPITLVLGTTSPTNRPQGQVEQRGRFSVLRETAVPGRCARRLLLPENYEIAISVRVKTVVEADLCGMADAVVESASAVLAKGQIPRRESYPDSLANQDACAAGTSARFPRLPGIDPAGPEPGFGRFSCTWANADRSETLQLDLARSNPFTEARGTTGTVAGREAFVDQEMDEFTDGCRVRVATRSYPNAYGSIKLDAVFVLVTSKHKPYAERCAVAKELAAAFFPAG
ncbi:protein kinase domain-containing protein [Crossiella sp. CA198]|uniref:serine/threonine-protein kinase n=1 Tax=Crossiella sp. CA198 TaxID=3455607 RepID=UPI003F8D4CDA